MTIKFPNPIITTILGPDISTDVQVPHIPQVPYPEKTISVSFEPVITGGSAQPEWPPLEDSIGEPLEKRVNIHLTPEDAELLASLIGWHLVELEDTFNSPGVPLVVQRASERFYDEIQSLYNEVSHALDSFQQEPF